MIQRIQTIYLLLIFGLMLTMPFLPVAAIQTKGEYSIDLKLWESILVSISALGAIFFYKNRKIQLIVCYAILELLVLSYLFILFDLWIPTQRENLLVFEAPIVFPFFAIILDVLAIGAIQKDEKLVRATDRLR
jgi:hypothetical protein